LLDRVNGALATELCCCDRWYNEWYHCW